MKKKKYKEKERIFPIERNKNQNILNSYYGTIKVVVNIQKKFHLKRIIYKI